MPVITSRSLSPFTSFSSTPSTSSTTVFVLNSMFGCAIARSSMIFDARNCSRRCSSVTFARKPRQEQRLLHRGIAAAHHRNLLAAEEEPVASRAA